MENRSRWRRLRRMFRRDPAAEVDDELEFHLEERVRDFMASGMDPEAARRAALERLGDLGRVRRQCSMLLAAERRAEERRRLISVSWLDVKLGVRMLAKYPGLSIVAVFGMAVAIAIGAGGFGLVHSIVDAPLPLDEGERIVSIHNADAEKLNSQDQQTAHDFLQWRDQLTTVRDLAAFTTARSTSLFVPGGSVHQVRIAQMTASGFRVARVAPVLGRPLLDDDERRGGSPVVVIAHEEWQRHFDGDPGIIGRSVRLDGEVHTVVGVMPEGFRFPVNHRYWVPLPLDPSANEVSGGPPLTIFGRLADGATVEQAQAELTTIGRRMALAHPETHEHLRPWVLPYIRGAIDIYTPSLAWLIRTFQLGLSLLLVVVSVNVTILVYARTAARTGEIAVRTALGASRGRVVTQLFAEAFVLSVLAAAVGLAIAVVGFDTFKELVTNGNAVELPFWFDLGLSPVLVAYTTGLAVLAAAIVGVFPALRATGRGVHGGLQQISSHASPMQLGRVWTTLIIVQVTVAVAVLPYALHGGGRFVRTSFATPNYPIDEFARVSLSVGGRDPTARSDPAGREANATRFTSSVAELVRRLEAEPEVAGVAVASRFPGSEEARRIEVEGAGTVSWVWMTEVDTDAFTLFDVPTLAGRGFMESDAARGSNTIIVDHAFAEQVLGGGNVLGRRVRRPAGSADAESGDVVAGPWLEIVGVVPAFTPPPPFQDVAPKLYRPLALADAGRSVQLAIRMRPGTAPAGFLSRVRETTHSVDPTLQLRVQTASEAGRLLRKGFRSLAIAVVAVTGSVLLLSAAGIYAMMSFTITARRREIGIRIALGAGPRGVLSGIFRPAVVRLGAGVFVGLLVAEAVPRVSGGSFFAGEGAYMLPVIVAILLAVGLLASFGPARRVLAVEPTEALRED